MWLPPSPHFSPFLSFFSSLLSGSHHHIFLFLFASVLPPCGRSAQLLTHNRPPCSIWESVKNAGCLLLNRFSLFVCSPRRLREATTQRTKEEEQAEAAVPGPEPAQRPLGHCANQSVTTERGTDAKLLAAAAPIL